MTREKVRAVYTLHMMVSPVPPYLAQKQTISAIACDMALSRPTVRKHLKAAEEHRYERGQAAFPKLDLFEEQLTK